MKDVVSRYVQLLSHEINNPLTVLCGQSALMRANLNAEAFDPKRMDSAITQVETNVNRVIELVRELREALREGTSGTAMLVPLGEVVDAARAFVRRDFVARDVALEIAPIPNDLLICADQVAVRGVLWRALGRALDRGGPVRVAWALTEAELRLSIRDAGPAADPLAPDLVALGERLRGSGADLKVRSDGVEIHLPRVD